MDLVNIKNKVFRTLREDEEWLSLLNAILKLNNENPAKGKVLLDEDTPSKFKGYLILRDNNVFVSHDGTELLTLVNSKYVVNYNETYYTLTVFDNKVIDLDQALQSLVDSSTELVFEILNFSPSGLTTPLLASISDPERNEALPLLGQAWFDIYSLYSLALANFYTGALDTIYLDGDFEITIPLRKGIKQDERLIYFGTEGFPKLNDSFKCSLLATGDNYNSSFDVLAFNKGLCQVNEDIPNQELSWSLKVSYGGYQFGTTYQTDALLNALRGNNTILYNWFKRSVPIILNKVESVYINVIPKEVVSYDVGNVNYVDVIGNDKFRVEVPVDFPYSIEVNSVIEDSNFPHKAPARIKVTSLEGFDILSEQDSKFNVVSAHNQTFKVSCIKSDNYCCTQPVLIGVSLEEGKYKPVFDFNLTAVGTLTFSIIAKSNWYLVIEPEGGKYNSLFVVTKSIHYVEATAQDPAQWVEDSYIDASTNHYGVIAWGTGDDSSVVVNCQSVSYTDSAKITAKISYIDVLCKKEEHVPIDYKDFVEVSVIPDIKPEVSGSVDAYGSITELSVIPVTGTIVVIYGYYGMAEFVIDDNSIHNQYVTNPSLLDREKNTVVVQNSLLDKYPWKSDNQIYPWYCMGVNKEQWNSNEGVTVKAYPSVDSDGETVTLKKLSRREGWICNYQKSPITKEETYSARSYIDWQVIRKEVGISAGLIEDAGVYVCYGFATSGQEQPKLGNDGDENKSNYPYVLNASLYVSYHDDIKDLTEE